MMHHKETIGNNHKETMGNNHMLLGELPGALGKDMRVTGGTRQGQRQASAPWPARSSAERYSGGVRPWRKASP